MRIFGLFHREASRTRAKDDPTLCAAADRVRSVISLPYRPIYRKGSQIRDITWLDLYETSEYLISHKMPIDVGDIFQKTGGKKQYILLEQPCDLMIRGDTGKRNAETVALVELVEKPRVPKEAKTKDSFLELEYYSEDEAIQCFVDMAKCVIVPACIVDL